MCGHTRRSYIFQVSSKSVQGFRSPWGSKFAHSPYFGYSLLQPMQAVIRQAIRSMERVSAQCCFNSIPCTIIPNSRLPRTALKIILNNRASHDCGLNCSVRKPPFDVHRPLRPAACCGTTAPSQPRPPRTVARVATRRPRAASRS